MGGPVGVAAPFPHYVRALPDALTYLRLALTIVTYPVAIAGETAAFIVLVLVIVITDVLDGPIARHAGVATERGANLDSASDFVFYASLPVWAFAFQAEAITRLVVPIALFFVAYVVANVMSSMRRGVIGFHNRWTRMAGLSGVVLALWTVIWGLDVVLVAAIVLLLLADLVQRFLVLARAGRPAGAR